MLALAFLAACGDREPDPRTVPGALAAALAAADAYDGPALYKLVDQRARRSLCAIVFDRHGARELVEGHYPESVRAPAVASLGDAATIHDAAGLFAHRCDAACFHWFSSTLGAPASVRPDPRGASGDVVVRTTAGHTLRMHRGSDGWWGVRREGENEALAAEALDAGRDRAEIEEAARVYDRRRDLATPLGLSP